MTLFKEQLEKMQTRPGFIAALDQSGGSTPNALRAYGIKEGAWSNEAEMFAIVHQMRTRIITSPSFTGERILGAILFENTMDRTIEGQPSRGLSVECETGCAFSESGQGPGGGESGVHLMKPMPDLSALLAKAKAKRIFGTKMRSVINQADRGGHQEHCEPAVRSGRADYCRGPHTDHRTGSGYSLPGKSQGRSAAEGGSPREA